MKITAPIGLEAWLYHQRSITDKLKEKSPNVYLECLFQGLVEPDQWENQHIEFESQDDTPILRREILMYAGKHRCWYARTIIPNTTYTKESERFARLKTESLGEIIWSSSDIERQNMQHFSFNNTNSIHTYIASTLGQNLDKDTLWGRLSRFEIKKKYPFYLLEIFLPELKYYDEYPSLDSLR